MTQLLDECFHLLLHTDLHYCILKRQWQIMNITNKILLSHLPTNQVLYLPVDASVWKKY